MKRLPLLVTAFAVCVLTAVACAADWPQYRHDAGRTAASPESLPANLHLAWVRELPAPRPAFPTELRLGFDATYEPVVLGGTMFVPSMTTDSLAALDTQTGAERWRFFTDGPVRLAPVAWQDKVYFVSDDGYLYCVGAADGKLLWKFRGLPADRAGRKVMGDGRLISIVPARGGPVVDEGVIYFAAGIWWGEGVFVHALDAATGKPIWSNLDCQRIEKANMDHGVGYFAGLSPQGSLAIVDGRLVVPCGAQLPAFLDLKTGKLATYTMGWGGRVGLPKGCAFVAGIGRYLMHGGDLYDVRRPNQERFRKPNSNDFKRMLYPAALTRLQIDRRNQKGLGHFRQPVLTEDAMYFQQNGIVACDLTALKIEERAKIKSPGYRKDDVYPDELRGTFPELWKLPSKSDVHIKAGGRLYCARPGVVEAVVIPEPGGQAEVAWQADVQGTPHRMLAADGKLFVVTREGSIYAFGGRKPAEPIVYQRPGTPAPQPDRWTVKAAELLEAAGIRDGYVVAMGLGNGRLVEELVRQSRCDVIAVDSDPDKVAKLRSRFQKAGLYGSRVSIYVGDPGSYPFPPYLAGLIVCEDPAVLGGTPGRAFVERVFRCLHPYGGTACLPIPDANRKTMMEEIAGYGLPRAAVREAGDRILLTREGALPETDDWSHSGANAANTGAAEDRFLKPPLVRLWFDGSVRWIRTPGATVVRVAGGRMFVKSGKLDATDVFTGRHLWQAALLPGNGPGGEIVAVGDAIYLPSGGSCVALDPATGKPSGHVDLPADVGGRWSNVRVAGDFLVGASGKYLLCMNRRNGRLVWKYQRDSNVGSIAMGGGKVFCADVVKRSPGQRQPDTPNPAPVTQAFDLATGKLLWQTAGASQVRFSEPLDLLVTAAGVYRANDGTRLWNPGAAWPITGDKLLSGNTDAFVVSDLLTGKKTHEPWKWNRRGCTPLRASAHLLTTRFQGNAAYVDLATGRITSIWNVRAACSNNVFPANGVLSLPNLSGGCTCNYLPTSQVLVPASVLE